LNFVEENSLGQTGKTHSEHIHAGIQESDFSN